MANMVYLNKNSDGEVDTLFEERRIPFFWFCLLDNDILVSQKDELLYNYKSGKQRTKIKISKQNFLKNALDQKEYIETYFSKEKNLYNDFIRYLDEKFNDEDLLEIDVLEMAWHNDMETLLGEIENTIELLRNNKSPEKLFTPWKDVDIVFQLVGYDRDYNDEFMEYSSDYEEACEDE
jgi:hypothetical protein